MLSDKSGLRDKKEVKKTINKNKNKNKDIDYNKNVPERLSKFGFGTKT